MLFKSHYDKKVVLDTSVILYDTMAVKSFHETDIYIPLPVIQEIDTFKRDMGEKGRNARQFSRFMDTLRNQGALTKGVFLQDCKSYVYVNMLSDYESHLPPILDNKKVDNQILGMALFIQQRFPKTSVELISKDINLRIKSDVFGVKSKNYDPDKIASVEDMYSGIRKVEVEKEHLEEFFKSGSLKLKEEKFLANQYVLMECPTELDRAEKNNQGEGIQVQTSLDRAEENQGEGIQVQTSLDRAEENQGEGIQVQTSLDRTEENQEEGIQVQTSLDRTEENQEEGIQVQTSPARSPDKQMGLGRYDKKQDRIVPLISNKAPIWRVHPRNYEQSFAFDALLNPNLHFVSLLGKAGTGKTLLALAAGLYKTMDENTYKKMLVCRPVFPMGKDIGYLPGDIEQKLNPWMQPVFDSLEYIMGLGKKASRITGDLVDQGLLSIEPLAYIRGRSIPNQYLIVDEAQNLTPHEIKTIITRAGTGTKVVLTGDCYQIDNPYIDASNSGLTYSIEKFKGQEIFAHITLKKGERSQLAELAANLL